MKSAHAVDRVHPLVIFWLGLLTGALVVGFFFLYRALNSTEYRNALLSYPTYYKTLTSPTKSFDSTYSFNTKSIGNGGLN
ncbi:hypothetical protein CO046_00800 [Candidatus Peregrinibacteria bacterium CG_4_9_14_0_2_um_filter_53_11]|nr:MAG: hypothetical protein CO046_00800 [Candidatus Peregrinibacteria bacterium CG_4_9_14_0_2_um_filter_53_11]